MSKKAPILDIRSSKDILNHLINKMKEQVPNWETRIDNNPGVLLQFIYARLMGISIERLNKVPEKSFLEFLDTMGLSKMTACPAKVPLTFLLKKNMPPTLVPKGTKASSADVTGKGTCVFETANDLTVLPMSIRGLITIDCIWNRYTEIISGEESKNRLFKPFIGEKLMKYSIRFSDLRLTNGFSDIQLALIWEKKDPPKHDDFKEPEKYKWFADEINMDLEPLVPDEIGIPEIFYMNPPEKTECYKISLKPKNFEKGDSRYIDSVKALCDESCGRKELSVDYNNFRVWIKSSERKIIELEHILYNHMEFYQGAIFTPFGRVPKKGDCFYLFCDEVFSKSGEDDELTFTLKVEGEDKSNSVEIRLWVHIGDGVMSWQNEGMPDTNFFSKQNPVEINLGPSSFLTCNDDRRYALLQFEMKSYPNSIFINTAGIEATLRPNPNCKDPVYKNVELLWFQSMKSITEYETIVSFIEGNNRESIIAEGKFIYLAAEIPPEISPESIRRGTLILNFNSGKILWEYYCENEWFPLKNITNNTKELTNGGYIITDNTKALTNSGHIKFAFKNIKQSNYVHNGISGKWIRGRLEELSAIYPVLERVYIAGYDALIKPKVTLGYEALTKPKVTLGYETLIEPNVDFDEHNCSNCSSFYIAFDKIYPEQPVSIYIMTENKRYNESNMASKIKNELKRDVNWEYFDGKKWRMLPVLDNTSGLTETGSIKFLTPKNMGIMSDIPRMQDCYWIRATKKITNPLSEVEISGIYLNTVDSIQTETYINEVLGSGTGKAGQKFKTGHKPIICGERVWVREPEIPLKDDPNPSRFSDEDNQVAIEANPASGEKEIWVMWREKANFISSDPKSRHYVIDKITGEISFGDGLHGMMVPCAPNNVRITYSITQGENGNVDASAVNKMVSQIPEIERVENMISANGGAAGESIDNLMVRGPQHLRNQSRALSYEDYEWLAVEAGCGQVARIKCLPCVNSVFSVERGWVTILVVPHGTEKVLIPDNMLKQKIYEGMKNKVFCGLKEDGSLKINISGPGYIGVDMTIAVSPQNIDDAQHVKENVLEALSNFLHPLYGGDDTKGWQFGRSVYTSEICQVVERILGVDHMIYDQLEIKPNSYQSEFTVESPDNEFEIQKGSLVISKKGKKSAIAVKDTIISGDCRAFAVRGFKEGDEITFSQEITCNFQKVDNGDWNVLIDEGITLPIDYPEGSMLVSEKHIMKTVCDLKSSDSCNEKVIAKSNRGSISRENNVKFSLLYPFPMTIIDVSRINSKIHIRVKPYLIEISGYMPETVSTIDNRIKLPIEKIDRDEDSKAIIGLLLSDFESSDRIAIDRNDFTLADVRDIKDVAYVSENYLVYPRDIRVDVTLEK